MHRRRRHALPASGESWFIVRTITATIGRALTPIGGPMTSGSRISSRCLPAKLVAREAPTSAPISIGKKKPDAR
jgi:hypothetical protein